MRRLLLLSVAMVVVALSGCGGGQGAASGASSSSSSPSGCVNSVISGSVLAFDSNGATDCSDALGASNIWVAAANGSGIKPLTSSETGSFDPAWSPDGSKIAFDSEDDLDGVSNANLTSNVWIMNADGTGVQPLTKLTLNQGNAMLGSYSPVWSPDSSKIAFLSLGALDGSNAPDNPGPSFAINLWVMNADGSAAKPLTRLTVMGAGCGDPVWSPDGSRIAYDAVRALDGSNSIPVARNVWVINADGSGDTPLTKYTLAGSGQPAWSPDGSKILFSSSGVLDGSDHSIFADNVWVMNADGSGAQPLTKYANTATAFPDSNIDTPRYSPDGTAIDFLSVQALDGSNALNNAFTFNIWTMNADGSGVKPVTKLTQAGPMSITQFAWSPDGARIAFSGARPLDGSDGIKGDLNIWVMNADGSGAMPLTKITTSTGPGGTPDIALNSNPSWKP